MANIKISELNELYEAQKDYNDYVPVVDTSADETKKISVKNLIRSNVQLIAVTDTEPAEYETGDKYYNTTDNRIYTATSSGWANAETPIRNIFYVVISDKTTYTYDDDNETLVSVGSASGSVVNNYSTSTTEGYSCNYVNNTIVNAYSESESNAYSTDYVNDALDYSTDEVNTHKKWIDGKDIYRKVLVYSNVSTDGITDDLSSLNINTMIDVKFRSEHSDGVNVNFGNWYNVFAGATEQQRAFYRKNTNVLRFTTTVNLDVLHVILEYTKTTD